MGLFSSSKKEKLIAIFDIGSGSVGGALTRIPLNGESLPTIVGSVRTDIKSRKDFDFNTFMNDMLSALGESATSLYNQKAGEPEEIVCVLASPWYLSETRVLMLSKEKPFIFTKRIASEIIEKEISSLTELYKNKYSDLDSIPEIIEQHTMSVSLNGYPVIDPVGKKCTSFEMNMVISLSPKLCMNKIRETLSKTFHDKKVTFSSFTLATYLAVRDKYISPDSYLLLDISGEITDVGIVTKGILESVLSFPFGKKTFFNHMCTNLDIEIRDAKELFKLYNDDNISLELKKKVIPFLDSIENSWKESFNQCINTLPRTLMLPNTIFLTADNDITKWFTSVLHNDKNTESKVPSSYKYNVITLNGSEFFNMCAVKGGECDPFLMIESIAIARKILK